MQSFGERLKKEREKQGVTLDEVCVSTKVAVRFLVAIEAENFEKLPGGIFNKGFVRAYAQHLGINDDEAVADYLQAAGLQPTVPLNTTPPGEVEAPKVEVPEARLVTVSAPEVKKPESKPAPVQVKKPAAALVQTTPPKQKNKAARAQGQQEKQQEKKKGVQPVRVPAPVLAPVATDEHWFPWGKVAFALLLIAFSFAMWGSFYRYAEEHSSQPVPRPVVNQTVIAPERQAVSTQPPAAAQTETASAATSPEVVPTPEPVNGSFQVVVQARETSWVSIVADGKEVMKEVLDASAQKAVEAHKEVIIKAGNIGALDFVFNGKKLPSQGGYDEVKTLTFDPNGLQAQPVKTAGL